MIRFLTWLGIVCLVGGIVLTVIDARDNAPIAIPLVLVAFGISVLLAIRRGYHKVRGVVDDARMLMSGEIQHARVVDVGAPKGIFNPESTVQLELEGEDGTVRSFEREIPVPFPVAWSHRLGKRFNVPLLGNTDLGELMAFELRREGMDVDLARPPRPPAGEETVRSG